MKNVVKATALICAWLSAGGDAAAQPSASARSLGVSYSVLQLAPDRYVIPFGWLVSLGAGDKRMVSSIVEFGANFRPRSRGSLQIYTLQGGVRIAPLRGRGVRPFGELVGGIVAAGCCREAAIRLVFEPGGGVDIPISDRASVEIAAGFPQVIADGGTVRLFRLGGGVSLALGKR